jgi:hypothetical protein
MRMDDVSSQGQESLSIDHETRAEALDILRDVGEWQFVPERWDEVAKLLGSMADGLAHGDVAAVRAATIDLELISPLRVRTIRIGTGDAREIPPPDPVRDRANRLIHTLDTMAKPTRLGETPQANSPDDKR